MEYFINNHLKNIYNLESNNLEFILMKIKVLKIYVNILYYFGNIVILNIINKNIYILKNKYKNKFVKII
jgi:hypothetical protein